MRRCRKVTDTEGEQGKGKGNISERRGNIREQRKRGCVERVDFQNHKREKVKEKEKRGKSEGKGKTNWECMV